MELKCCVQSYAWGKIGRDSEVALLCENTNPDFVISDTKPYAELWMGSHPSGPSVIKESNQNLDDWISSNANSLGEGVLKSFGKQLPFLFKVLSVNKSLSIQAHPDKALAEKLHHLNTSVYKDPNHKPELAIALTPFEALCGFRPIKEIKRNIQVVTELQEIIGEEAVSNLMSCDEMDFKEPLKACFERLMVCPKPTVHKKLQDLLCRAKTVDAVTRESLQEPLLQRLTSDFPGDVGCFGIYFFNQVRLNPGESIYLGPNEPHAYLSGDCIECMACSDNVVRCGLTPKHKDVETLCNMLTYNCDHPSAKLFEGKIQDDYTVLYQPPVLDFGVAKIKVPVEVQGYNLISRKSASIVIVIEGEASSNVIPLKRGTVFFLPANKICSVSVEGKMPLHMYQAFAGV